MLRPKQCRMARVGLNWTVRDLGKKAGVNFNTVVKFENGGDPRLSIVEKIHAALTAEGFSFPSPTTIQLPPEHPTA